MIYPVCSEQLHWNSEEMASDISGVETQNNDDDYIVGFYTCPNCGREITVCDVPPARQSEFPYYTNN